MGSFHNLQFRVSTYEYDQHLSQVIELYEKCKQLACWCIWHDKVSHNDHRIVRTTKARALVAYLFQMQCSDLYGESWQHIAVPHGVELSHDIIIKQFELDVNCCLEMFRSGHQAQKLAIWEQIAAVKLEAKRRQIHFYQVQVQVLADAASTLLSGRRIASQWAKEPSSLVSARTTLNITNQAVERTFRKTASVRDRFFYPNSLKTAIAQNINLDVHQKLGGELSDLDWLSAFKQESERYLTEIESATIPTDGGIPLSEALQGAALSFVNELTEQVAVELGKLGRPKDAAHVESVLGKHGRSENGEEGTSA